MWTAFSGARLRQLRLRSWVCEPEGEAVASHLVSLLVNEHLSETGVLFILAFREFVYADLDLPLHRASPPCLIKRIFWDLRNALSSFTYRCFGIVWQCALNVQILSLEGLDQGLFVV